MEVRFIRMREIEIPKAFFILVESLATAQSVKRQRTQKFSEGKEISPIGPVMKTEKTVVKGIHNPDREAVKGHSCNLKIG